VEQARVRRCVNGEELLAFARPHEPHAIFLTAAARLDLRREARAWLAESGGDVVGAVVSIRLCFDRWFAGALVLDEVAAAPLARVIDRSNARQVMGLRAHVESVLPHLRRLHRVLLLKAGSIAPGVPAPEAPDPRGRVATNEDLPALLELYRGYELDVFPTTRSLQRYLEPRVARGDVVVVEVEGRIVGADRVEFHSDAYWFWGGLTVLPERRGEKLAWGLMEWAWRQTSLAGGGFVWCQAETNPMPLHQLLDEHPSYDSSKDEWVDARLTPRKWFRGHNKLRVARERAGGRMRRRPVVAPGPRPPGPRWQPPPVKGD